MNNTEIWKNIPFAPKYDVSNYGQVKSYCYKEPRNLKLKTSKCGYKEVRLSIDGKPHDYLVHRLVMMTFNPISDPEKYEVNHIDENKENNNISNLEWVKSKYNCNYGSRNRRISNAKNERVRCVESGVVYNSAKEASILTDTCRSSISNCLKGKREKAGGFHWERVEEAIKGI